MIVKDMPVQNTLDTLAAGESIIYIATRLFDYSEKIKAEDIEQAVKKGIHRAMRKVGIAPKKDFSPTFVPFRDTTQKGGGRVSAQQDGGDQLNRRIYLEDTARLNRSFALIGFFDGLSKDEGVCMEIGYAYGIGRPIILVMSDFVRADFKGVPDSEHLVDPVIGAIASKIIYQYSISETEASFRDQLQASLEMLYSKVEEETYLLSLKDAKKAEEHRQEIPITLDLKYDVCIDFGGGLFEWQRILQERLAENLIHNGSSVTICDRYSYYANHVNDVAITDLGWRDIKKVQSSKIVVTCSDSTEMDSGTAALQGFSRAVGKKVLLYNSKTTNMVGDTKYRSSRNLMIDYSAHKIASKFDDLPISVEGLLKD